MMGPITNHCKPWEILGLAQLSHAGKHMALKGRSYHMHLLMTRIMDEVDGNHSFGKCSMDPSCGIMLTRLF